MESKFKIGDKVRFNSEWGSYRFEDSLTKGEVVEISDITDCGSIYVKKYIEAWVTNDEIELVEQDTKTAFLTELKELMERYNAMITVMRPTQGNPILALESEDFKLFYTTQPCTYTSITPSNIFDYDRT